MSLLRRRAMMESSGGEEMKEWKLIGTKTFSEEDLGTSKFDFDCNGCTEFFICDDNLLSNQTMGYSIQINDAYMSVNHNVKQESGIRHREISLEHKGNRWCENCVSFDYETLAFTNPQTVMGEKNTGIGVANKISITQSKIQDYQIYSGTIEIWGR